MFFHWKLQDLPSLWLRLQPFKFCLGSGSTALALTGLWERFDSFQTQHKTQECSRSPTNINNYDNSDRNCAQHSTDCSDDYYRHTGIAYHVAYSRHTVAPRFQSTDMCWVCMCKALSLIVLYQVRCVEGTTFQRKKLFMEQLQQYLRKSKILEFFVAN